MKFLEIQSLFHKYDETHNKSLDWLMASFGESDETERKICRLRYKKHSQKAEHLLKKLNKLL